MTKLKQSLRGGWQPSVWRVAHVALLHKKGNGRFEAKYLVPIGRQADEEGELQQGGEEAVH